MKVDDRFVSLIRPHEKLTRMTVGLMAHVFFKKYNALVGPRQKVLHVDPSRLSRLPSAEVAYHVLFKNQAVEWSETLFQGGDIDIIVFSAHSPAWVLQYVEVLNMDLRVNREFNALIKFPSPDVDPRKTVVRALEVLSDSAPVFFDLVKAMVRQVIVVGGEDFVGASSKIFLGAIVIKSGKDFTVADCIDALVHEASHIDLYIRQWVDPFVKNPGRLIPSPLRKYDRPSEAVIHAVFVLARVCSALMHINSTCSLGKVNSDAQRLLISNVLRLNDGIETLKTSGGLTYGGGILLEAARTIHRETSVFIKSSESNKYFYMSR